MPVGTFINTIAVIIGSCLGLFFHKSIPEKVKSIFFQATGLSTILIGIQMGLKVENLLVVIFGLIIGGAIGELINLEMLIEKLGNKLKSLVHSSNEKFTDGLTTSFLIFCIGSMTIVGSLNEGISGDRSLLLTKSLLDGFTSIALASTYGIGVLFSAIPLLIFQSSLTLSASSLQQYFSPYMIAQITAVGGLLIVGIGINLLEIKRIKVTNLLPSLIVVAILSVFITA
jgi:uncharacterized membrane protein YqgA involved in biofilm formation